MASKFYTIRCQELHPAGPLPRSAEERIRQDVLPSDDGLSAALDALAGPIQGRVVGMARGDAAPAPRPDPRSSGGGGGSGSRKKKRGAAKRRKREEEEQRAAEVAARVVGGEPAEARRARQDRHQQQQQRLLRSLVECLHGDVPAPPGPAPLDAAVGVVWNLWGFF